MMDEKAQSPQSCLSSLSSCLSSIDMHNFSVAQAMLQISITHSDKDILYTSDWPMRQCDLESEPDSTVLKTYFKLDLIILIVLCISTSIKSLVLCQFPVDSLTFLWYVKLAE